MNEVDLGAFRALFAEACLKCFGHAVTEPLSETESRLLYTRIFEETGLVIGVKSLKNYSVFVFSPAAEKEENPSAATLDSLSRYVMGAPYTTEPQRKKSEGHYPYWWRWREGWVRRDPGPAAAPAPASVASPELPADAGSAAAGSKGRRSMRWVFAGLALLLVGVTIFATGPLVVAAIGSLFRTPEQFRDDFHAISADSLAARGWWVVAPDTVYWNKRGVWPGGLTLYTMKGDNWPDPDHPPVIRNLLQRRVPCGMFTLEWHLDHFIPYQDWQQAGILLTEDTGSDSRSLRISIAYNDYNGVYPRSGMILLQAIVSRAGMKPEEIAHVPLFSADSLRRNPALTRNLDHSALRVVMEGGTLRILYAEGILANTSFRQMASYPLPMEFRYVGLFALKGFVDSTAVMPARFSYFSLNCEKRK